MKPQLEQLQDYPFQRLAGLKQGIKPAAKSHIALSIGEPRHTPPSFVLDELERQRHRYSQYPSTRGLDELRRSCALWLEQRFGLGVGGIDPECEVLPVAGTREALFSIAQCCIDPSNHPKVIMPNPFYQIYEGAALLAGAEPLFLECTESNHYIPDFDSITEQQWRDTQLVYICTPGNPTGAVCDIDYLKQLIELAHKHDFIIVSDECYSEIWLDTPPPGLLQACKALGLDNYRHCLVMHSLSKRSNLAGLRSGFVAGDRTILKSYLQYRTYHGATLPVPVQLASALAWADEDHVAHNRQAYKTKFERLGQRFADSWPQQRPEAGFFYWAHTPIDGEAFAQALYRQQNVTVLPGSYLSRTSNGSNPGKNRVRMALVGSLEECEEAADRICEFIATV